jgi:hypothetical protein
MSLLINDLALEVGEAIVCDGSSSVEDVEDGRTLIRLVVALETHRGPIFLSQKTMAALIIRVNKEVVHLYSQQADEQAASLYKSKIELLSLMEVRSAEFLQEMETHDSVVKMLFAFELGVRIAEQSIDDALGVPPDRIRFNDLDIGAIKAGSVPRYPSRTTDPFFHEEDEQLQDGFAKTIAHQFETLAPDSVEFNRLAEAICGPIEPAMPGYTPEPFLSKIGKKVRRFFRH